MVVCGRRPPVKKLVLALALLGMVAAGLSAEKAEKGFYLDQSIQASYNPLGFQFLTQVYYRIPLVDKEGVLWESTKIDLGLQNNLSPAYDMIGAYIDIEPIAIFDLALTAQVIGFYDALSFGFYSLAGYGAGFDDTALSVLTPRNTLGYTLSATPTFKIAFGPIALADSFGLTYFYADDGSGFFYERVNNTVLAKSDYELTNNAYLLATIVPGVLVGLNDFLLVVPNSGYISHRIVAMGVYTTTFTPKLSFNAVLQLGTFLQDAYYQYSLYVGGQVGISLAL
jgi:hypothetical protein